jgi:multidrug efflux pump subunit AcrA (membrane-fusion protein)/YHS domain-containing protein
VLADLFEQDGRHYRPGRAVRVRHGGETLEARVSAALPAFDTEAQTTKVRLEVENPGYRLRPGMFVDVELPVDLPETLAVPAAAVVDTGRRKTVFVDLGDGHFEPRAVTTGWRYDDQVEILDGLMPGERIVVSGSFLIDSESRMRAATAGPAGPPAKDPVCGMAVDTGKAEALARTSRHGDATFHFCSDLCKKQFDAEPARWAGR